MLDTVLIYIPLRDLEMEFLETYQYVPLVGPDSFRLIMLHPSANLDDPVRCDLQSASLVEYDLSISSYYIALPMRGVNLLSVRVSMSVAINYR